MTPQQTRNEQKTDASNKQISRILKNMRSVTATSFEETGRRI